MYNRVRRAMLTMLMGLGLVLAGCIQPISEVDQTKTVQATLGFSPISAQSPTSGAVTPAPSGGATTASQQLPDQVAQFVSGRGDISSNLQIWYDGQRGLDRLIGFSYTGSLGTPCAGFLVLVSANGGWLLSDSGALYCSQATVTDGFAANTFILTSDGQPNTIVFGRIEQAAVSVVQIQFDDGSSQSSGVAQGGFLIVKSGVTSPTMIVGTDAQGSVILPAIQYSPV